MKRKILSDIVNNFNEITGIELAIATNERKCICFSKTNGEFCAALHQYPKAYKICEASDDEHIKKMEAEGKPIRYVCPFGVDEMLLPIESRSGGPGFMFSSIGITRGRDMEPYIKFAQEEAGVPRAVIEKKITTVPKYTPERIDAFAKILTLMADYISAKDLMPDEEYTVGTLIKNYVKDNISKKITLSDMAWHLHRSTVSLTEHFKAEFGMTIMEYVTEKRLKMAEEMLCTTDKLVKEISVSCGFSDVEYFSRCFKRRYGLTPTEYRESRRAAQS